MVTLTNENSLLQEIEYLAANGKIQNTVGLTAQDAKSKIEEIIPTIKPRINAARFYLDLIESMDTDFYQAIPGSSTIEESQMISPREPFINFSDDKSFHVQIKLLRNSIPTLREKSELIVFIVLNGFFSNLVSSADCVAKVINIVYNLISYNKSNKSGDIRQELVKIRKELIKKRPNGILTSHLLAFYPMDQDRNLDKIGSRFNIPKGIRNELVHGDTAVVRPGTSIFSASKLHFHDSFFPSNTNPADTEMIAFCQKVYDETVNFVDTCYRLICADLQHNGVLPVPKGE